MYEIPVLNIARRLGHFLNGTAYYFGSRSQFFFSVVLWPSVKVEMMSGDVLES